MKCLRKRKVEIDWKIHAIADERQRENPKAIIDYTTFGFDKYGYGEVTVVGKVKNAAQIGELINTFGRMLAEGQIFRPNAHHVIDDEYGNKMFGFDLFFGKYNDEDFILLMPDFESGTIKLPVRLFKDLSDIDEEMCYDDIQLDDDLPITLNGVYCDALHLEDDFYTVLREGKDTHA